MHKSSYKKMRNFVRDYLTDKEDQPLRILEIGSQDINGTRKGLSYKALFDKPLWKYTGLDMEAGENVDVVVEDPYDWKQISNESYDVVFSGSCFEHVEFPWLTIKEIARVLKVGGLTCNIAPAVGEEHRYPVDCWRIYPDGFIALAKWAKLEPLYTHANWKQKGLWVDSVLIAKK